MLGSILLTFIFIFLNAIFSCAEIAVLSTNEVKLKKLSDEGDKRADKLLKLTEQPSKFLSTIQVAITLAGFLNSAFAADNFNEPLTDLIMMLNLPLSRSTVSTISIVIVTLILSYFSIVLGELIPKRLAMAHSEKISLALASILYGVSVIASPIVSLLTISTNAILRLLGMDPNQSEEQVSEEEIRMMLAEGNQQGTIDASENEMIQNVFDFDDTDVEAICTHRIDVTYIDYDEPLEEWDHIIKSTRHSNYPIYQESIDNIIAILDTKDYFRTDNHSKEEIMKTCTDKPWFVSETEKCDELFEKMQNRRQYLAILLDEYGGVSGIVTLHDLMETLVGDLYEPEEIIEYPEIKKISDTQYHIQGYASLEKVAEVLDIELPVDEYDTFNGFICDVIERIPNNGERFTCKYQNIDIQVNGVSNHTIDDTIVTINPIKKVDEQPLAEAL